MAISVTWDGTTYSIPQAGEINWPSLTNFLVALGQKAAIADEMKQAIRVATVSPVVISDMADFAIVTNLDAFTPVTVNLPAGLPGRIFAIVDGKGNASIDNITIYPLGTDTIAGAEQLVMNKDRQVVWLQYFGGGTDWKIINYMIPPGQVVDADISGVISTPGKVSGDAITSGTIGGSTAINTSGALTINGATALNGGVTLGDQSSDALTINSLAVSIPNNLNIDSNTLFINASTNRVGIGNTSPTTALDVSGTVTATTVAATTVNAVSLNSSGNTALGDGASDVLTINGTAVTLPNGLNFDSNTLVIDAANNRVGVGIASPTVALDVVGAAKVSTDLTVNGNTQFGDASTDVMTIQGTAITIPNGLNFDSNTLVVDAANNRVGVGIASPTSTMHVFGNMTITNTGASDCFVVEDSASPDTSPFVIDTNGRILKNRSISTDWVGIGGQAEFQIHGNFPMSLSSWSTTAISSSKVLFTKSNSNTIGTGGLVTVNTNLGTLEFAGSFADGVGFGRAAQIIAAVDYIDGANAFIGGRVVFNTITNFAGGPPLESMRIDSSGRVGIGTTPSELLHVNGNVRIDGNTTLGDASTDTVTIQANSILIPNNLNFDANTLVIDAVNNRVGIGTVTPTQALDVVGTITATSISSPTVGGTTVNAVTLNVTGNTILGDSTADTLTISGNSTQNGTGFIKIASGATADRPVSPVDGMMRYNTDLKTFEGRANNTWALFGGIGSVNVLPSDTGTQNINQYLDQIVNLHVKNVNARQRIATYINGVTTVLNAYNGAVYSPSQNRIYLIPSQQANQTNWHYIDCATGSVVAYAHGVTAVADAYWGGVYSPTQNRIYLVPNAQSNQTNWHYIDCSTGSVVAYAHGITAVANGYAGGVYSPTQNRIYLVPYGQSNQTNWHYINCATGSVVAYAHGISAVAFAYVTGGYSPTQNRIYLSPLGQATQTNWHYIDCSTGSVVAYAHGVTAASFAYQGAVYSPTQNRIYFVPATQGNVANWHYVDCSTGSVVAYAHGVTAVYEAYHGGVYSPTQNRIYFVPYEQASQTNWHYIDCATGSVVAYAHGVTALTAGYQGGSYAPTQNRIYFAPTQQSSQARWHFVASTASAELAPALFGSTLLSSTL
jgi:hypothetical protein